MGEQGFPAIQVYRERIGKMHGADFFEKCPSEQEIPVAMHDGKANSALDKLLEAFSHFPVEWVVEIVVSGPRIEKIAQDVKPGRIERFNETEKKLRYSASAFGKMEI